MTSSLNEQDVATKAWKGSWGSDCTSVIVTKQAEVTYAGAPCFGKVQGPGLSKHNPVGPQKHKV